MRKKLVLGIVGAALGMTLSACSSATPAPSERPGESEHEQGDTTSQPQPKHRYAPNPVPGAKWDNGPFGNAEEMAVMFERKIGAVCDPTATFTNAYVDTQWCHSDDFTAGISVMRKGNEDMTELHATTLKENKFSFIETGPNWVLFTATGSSMAYVKNRMS